MSSTATVEERSSVPQASWITIDSRDPVAVVERDLMTSFGRERARVLRGEVATEDIDLDTLAKPSDEDVEEARSFFTRDLH